MQNEMINLIANATHEFFGVFNCYVIPEIFNRGSRFPLQACGNDNSVINYFLRPAGVDFGSDI